MPEDLHLLATRVRCGRAGLGVKHWVLDPALQAELACVHNLDGLDKITHRLCTHTPCMQSILIHASAIQRGERAGNQTLAVLYYAMPCHAMPCHFRDSEPAMPFYTTLVTYSREGGPKKRWCRSLE